LKPTPILPERSLAVAVVGAMTRQNSSVRILQLPGRPL
jgi:hypothetical protein